ncbi:MAG: type II toxin-antitoxin system Phd/YefM family antitoxin [Sporichthyaceae bacterium]
MAVSPSELRANIYRLLDEVLETGVPLEVERKGRRLRIVAEEPVSKLDRLVPHPDFVIGDPDDLVEMDWSGYWNPDPL